MIAEVIEERYGLMVLWAGYCSLRFDELVGLRRSRMTPLHRSITVEEEAVELTEGTVTFGPSKAAGRSAGITGLHFHNLCGSGATWALDADELDRRLAGLR